MSILFDHSYYLKCFKIWKNQILYTYISIVHFNSFMSILLTYRYITSILSQHMLSQHSMSHQHLNHAFCPLHVYIKCLFPFISNKNIHGGMHMNKKLFFQHISSISIHFLSLPCLTPVNASRRDKYAKIHELSNAKQNA
jgi:serine acetyltransferase